MERISTAHRTCDLILGVGDGKVGRGRGSGDGKVGSGRGRRWGGRGGGDGKVGSGGEGRGSGSGRWEGGEWERGRKWEVKDRNVGRCKGKGREGGWNVSMEMGM